MQVQAFWIRSYRDSGKLWAECFHKPRFKTFKENFSTCTSSGLQCYLNTRVGEDECGMPCSGIYADIDHVQDDSALLDNEKLASLKETYEHYKRGGNHDVKYPNELAGN